MIKTDVEKTLKKGSAKQRALIVINHIVELNAGNKGLLSEKELQTLVNGFKTDQEIKMFNSFKRINEHVRLFLTYLAQYKLSYMETLGNLDKFLVLRQSHADMEDLVNSLIRMMPSEKLQDKASRLTMKYSSTPLLRIVGKDEEGNITMTKGISEFIKFRIDKLRSSAIDEQIDLKTAIQLIKDFSKEKGFKIRIYNDFVQEVEKWAKSKKVTDHYYLSTGLFIDSGIEKDGTRLDRLLKENRLEIPYDEVDVDQDKYQTWRREFLNA